MGTPKYLISMLGVFFLVAITPSAHAVTYSLQFTGSFGVGALKGLDAPQDLVIGTLIFEKDPLNFTISSLTSISLMIDAHSYDISEVNFANDFAPGLVSLHALINGIGLTPATTNDFFFTWLVANGAANSMGYTSENPSVLGDVFLATSVSSTFTPLAAVPFKAFTGWSSALATGLAALGLLGWRRKRKQATAMAMT